MGIYRHLKYFAFAPFVLGFFALGAQTCPTTPTYNSNTNITIGTGETCDVAGSVSVPSNRSPDINMTGDGRMVIDGDLTFGGNTTINMNTSDTLRVNGDLTLEGNGDLNLTSGVLYVTGSLTINGNAAFGAGGNVFVGIDFTVTGNNADVTVSGGFNVAGTTDIGSETLTVEGGAVFKSGSYTSSGSNITVESGGTIAVDAGIPAGASVDGGNADTDCSNNCCGDQCNPSGDALNGDAAAVLPISLLYFDAFSESSEVRLAWATATEIDNDYFTIERSYDGKTFEPIAYLSGAGDSKDQITYEYFDRPPGLGLIYYRLTQTDFDGKFERFPLASVRHVPMGSDQLKVYPTLLTPGDPITIEGGWGRTELVELMATDMRGAGLSVTALGETSGALTIPTAHIPPGIYVLRGHVNGFHVSQRIVVNN